jgi:VCBS repeat-containing protein
MSATVFLKSIRCASLVTALTLAFTVAASAETLLMPKRDGIRNQQLVIWGVTTQANGSAFTLTYGDGTQVTGSVVDRSYIAFTKTYAAAGTYTVTLTVGAEPAAQVEIRIFDPATLPGGVNGEAARALRINMAIENGLRYLWTSQASRAANFPLNAQTLWNQGASWPQQWTALVALAFQNHGYRLSNDGTPPTGIYEKYIVRRALNYVIANLGAVTIASQGSGFGGQPVRNPCVGVATNPCTGLAPNSSDRGYATGIAMLPLAGSGALNRVNTEAAGAALNMTYREILQRLSNALAWGQTDQNGAGRGGWGYNFNQGNFDGSTVGWALLGLMDAEAAGIEVPSWVKTEFAFGLTGALNNNGSLDYGANGSAVSHANPNLEKAGIGLQGMFFIGEIGGARADLTQDYISDRWNSGRLGTDYTGWSCGAIPNRGCGYAMFNNFKGLKLQNIQTLPGVTRPAGPGAIPAGDWYADYQDWLVNNQTNPTLTTGGNWAGMLFGPISTSIDAAAALAELILSPVALVLPDADKFATVGLSPTYATAVEGNTHTVTAKAESEEGTPVAGATVNFEILSGPNAGLTFSAVTNASGLAMFTYTDAGPIPSFGTDRIRASIGTLQSNIAEMEWTPFNRPPVATNNDYSVNEDGTLNGNVVFDAPADSDPDNDELHASVESDVTHGMLSLLSSGGFSYLPIPNYCGPDSFTYSVNDGMYDSDVATVTIDVVCVNDAPVAIDESATTTEDTPVGGQLESTDIDGGAPAYSLNGGASNGLAVVNADGSFTYTPAPDFCGADSFTFTVNDGSASDGGTVSVSVDCVNDPPVADDATATTNEDVAVGGQLTSSDLDGPSAAYALDGGASNGAAVVNADGTFTYTPNANYCGNDSFTFTVSDGTSADGASVNVTVTCVNDAPVANDSAETTSEDTPLSAAATSSDIDGPGAAYAVTTGPAHGTVTMNADGTYVYTPALNYNGPDSFTFTVNDGNGGSDTGQVSINVAPVNDAPFCAAAAPSVTFIWPPNHQLVDVTINGVTDPVEDSAITITVDGIWQDEPTDTIGDGNTSVDGYGVGTSTAQVRAERSGSKRVPGNGRMYHIFFTGTDAQGGTCTGTVKVAVPHDMGEEHTVGDGGALYKSTGS